MRVCVCLHLRVCACLPACVVLGAEHSTSVVMQLIQHNCIHIVAPYVCIIVVSINI